MWLKYIDHNIFKVWSKKKVTFETEFFRIHITYNLSTYLIKFLVNIFTTFQVETTETSEEPISHELTNPPEAIHEEVVETTEIKETEQLEHFEPDQEESPSASASSRSSPTPSTKSSNSSSSPVSSSEEIKNDVHSDEEWNPIKIR